jgi:hypothetical protein
MWAFDLIELNGDDVRRDPGERIIRAHACRDCVRHHLRESRAGKVCLAWAGGTDSLDDVASRSLWHLTHEPMAMRREDWFQDQAVHLLRGL